MKGQHAYLIWYRIKDMVMLNKSLSHKELIRAPLYDINVTLDLLTQHKLFLLEENYTIDEIVQYFGSILFVTPWADIESISPYQTDMKDVSFLFHTEPIDFYKYFRMSMTNIFLNNLTRDIDEIFCPENIKNLYPSILTINQLYVISKIWDNTISEKGIYRNIVSNWPTLCQFDLNQHIDGSKKIIAKIKNKLDEKFNVL